ncbi:MAG: hypothetical protein HY705_00880 [Gemmatimonadetes bacterium]|nr:hypothetical protein [Gemmatimonadota bacterium]
MRHIPRDVRDSHGVPKIDQPLNRPVSAPARLRTRGTDRDFDVHETSANQAHGHPRGERRAGKVRSRRGHARGVRGGHAGQGKRR